MPSINPDSQFDLQLKSPASDGAALSSEQRHGETISAPSADDSRGSGGFASTDARINTVPPATEVVPTLPKYLPDVICRDTKPQISDCNLTQSLNNSKATLKVKLLGIPQVEVRLPSGMQVVDSGNLVSASIQSGVARPMGTEISNVLVVQGKPTAEALVLSIMSDTIYISPMLLLPMHVSANESATRRTQLVFSLGTQETATFKIAVGNTCLRLQASGDLAQAMLMQRTDLVLAMVLAHIRQTLGLSLEALRTVLIDTN